MRELSRVVPRVDRGKSPVTLHLMVKNGESVVGRLLDCVGPYVAGVVAVLNDCEDETERVLASSCRKHRLYCQVVPVTWVTHPLLYRLDVPETYQVGRPYCGESFPGPYTGRSLLVDWSGARNCGWRRCSARWKFVLDADDVVDDPEVIPGLCQLLDKEGLEAAATRYHYHRTGRGDWRADAYRERLARNFPWLRWRDKVHEVLTGHTEGAVARVEGSLVVRDLRDSSGEGLRPPLRNLKALYLRARQVDWELTPRETAYLAAESRLAMPELCRAMAVKYLSFPDTWAEEAGWVCALAGEVDEEEGHLAEASRWYQRSLARHPGTLAAYRLARAEFRQGRWGESLVAYEIGLANEAREQGIDGGEVSGDAAGILAVACLEKLGRLPEARALCSQVRARFPENRALAELARVLETKEHG